MLVRAGKKNKSFERHIHALNINFSSTAVLLRWICFICLATGVLAAWLGGLAGWLGGLVGWLRGLAGFGLVRYCIGIMLDLYIFSVAF